MKRAILLSFVLFVLLQPAARGQERGPLVMRITFEWTMAGAIGGAFVGFAVWLTDPGNPNIQLNEQLIRGGALGAVLGAGYSLFVLQRSMVLPARPLVEVRDPLDPRERITSDPVAAASGFDRPSLSSALPGGGGGSAFRFPVFGFKF